MSEERAIILGMCVAATADHGPNGAIMRKRNQSGLTGTARRIGILQRAGDSSFCCALSINIQGGGNAQVELEIRANDLPNTRRQPVDKILGAGT